MNVPLAPKNGDVIAGKYRIENPLGEGGMAVVFSAMHLALNRPVALKFVRPWALGEDEARQRFMREAQATFSLRSEHAVRMLDLGELPSGDLFLVMELLEGKNLSEVIQERRAVSEIEAARFIRQACDAIAEAHALGIVHRDLKPANLFLTMTPTGKPCVKVLDFGLAKIGGSLGPGSMAPITQMATTLGTPKYMAPEQWERAARVDGRADIFSLGVILFQLLTSKVPHEDLPLDERVRMILAGAVPSPRTLRPDVSETMARIVMRCLRPVPEERFATAQELSEALGQVELGPTATPRLNPMLHATGITAVVPDAVKRAVQREVAVIQGHASSAAESVSPEGLAPPLNAAPPGKQDNARRDAATRVERAIPVAPVAPQAPGSAAHSPAGTERLPAVGTERLPAIMGDAAPESVRTEKMDRPAFEMTPAPAPVPAQGMPLGRTLLSHQNPVLNMPTPAAPVVMEPPRAFAASQPEGSGLHGAYAPPQHPSAHAQPPMSGMAHALPPPSAAAPMPMSGMGRAYVPPKKKPSTAAIALILIAVILVGIGVVGVALYMFFHDSSAPVAPAAATPSANAVAPPVPSDVPAGDPTAASVSLVAAKKKTAITTTKTADASVAAAPETPAATGSTAPNGLTATPPPSPPSVAAVPGGAAGAGAAPVSATPAAGAKPAAIDAGSPRASPSNSGRGRGKGQ
jgi:serine/threonine-protein kinase